MSRFDYDDHGNVKRQRTEIYGFGEKELKYDYDLVSGNACPEWNRRMKRVWYQDGKLDYFGHGYKYDADNRLTEVFTSKDNVFWDRDAHYRYYAHGPLARLEIGEDAVQGLDYFYTLQGWIKGMNMAGDVEGKFDPGEDGRDLAGGLNRWTGRDGAAFQLGFFEGEYTGIGNPSLGSGDHVWTEMGGEILGLNGEPKGLWNGNVPVMLTDLRFGPGGMGEAHGYAYKYDGVQRIKEGRSYEQSTTGWKRFAGISAYDANYAYDGNGNLEALQRAMPVGTTQQGTWMDDFAYRYDLNSSNKKEDNKLRFVSDQIGSGQAGNDLDDQAGGLGLSYAGRNYHYDAIGNLIADSTEMVDSIVWDLSGKILAVKRTAAGSAAGMADLAFGYDGSGNRVWKRSIASGDTTTTFYVRDAQGMPMAVYERVKGGDDSVLTYLKEWTIYGAERLGLDLAGKLVDVQTGDFVANPPQDGQRTLLVAEVVYDSPLAKDGLKNEDHEGEYVELVNVSGGSLDLAGISLLSTATSESVDLSGSLEDGERLVLTYTEKAACNWPLSYVRKTAGKTLVCTDGWSLPDGGGAVEARRGSAVLDAVAYGKDAGLDAANGYSAAVADPVNAVRRWVYGYADTSAYAAKQSVSVDFSTLEIEPVPVSGPSGGLFGLARGGKAYEVSNHLGNVLAVVSDLKLGRRAVPNSAGGVDWYEPEVLSLSDYYPFGMEMVGRSFVSGRYRYGFNGKEHDDDWNGGGNMYDYGYRIYDPRVSRFLSVDPLASSFPWFTPYQYAGNMPINSIDLDGLENYGTVKDRDQVVSPSQMPCLVCRTSGTPSTASSNQIIYTGLTINKARFVPQQTLSQVNRSDGEIAAHRIRAEAIIRNNEYLATGQNLDPLNFGQPGMPVSTGMISSLHEGAKQGALFLSTELAVSKAIQGGKYLLRNFAFEEANMATGQLVGRVINDGGPVMIGESGMAAEAAIGTSGLDKLWKVSSNELEGELYLTGKTTFYSDISAGQTRVAIAGDIIIERNGTHIIFNDISFWPMKLNGEPQNALGLKNVLLLRKEFLQWAKKAGFKTASINGERVVESTSKMKGTVQGQNKVYQLSDY